MRGDDKAEDGWLPVEIWAKIVDEHVPPVRRGTITGVALKEDGDNFDPYVLSSTSCADFEGQLIRPDLAGVNRQLHALLDGTYLVPQECLVVTNENARRLRLRLERTSSAAGTPFTQHISFILRLSPGAGEALNDFAGILRLVQGITVLSFGTVMDPGVDPSRMDVGALDASISRFSESFRLRSSELLRLRFLEGASFLFADILGERQQLIEGCTALRVLSFHRRFHDPDIKAILGFRDIYVTVLQPTSTQTLSYVIMDSPHVYYNDGDMICTHFHYVIENGPGAVPSYPGILRAMSLNSAPMPITHLSLECMLLDSGTLRRWALAWVSKIRYLRLNAPLSRLTACVTSFIPASVRTLVLVVNYDYLWETDPHSAAKVASWELLHNLLLGIKHAKGQHGCQLERVQFVQSALAERIRSELTAHENLLKEELINVGIAIVDERNESLW